ncbi:MULTISPECIES: heavy metal translocating P-type ATPase [unclassified Caballeronia]|uniref:heavy metal translocating P-type ATPase n=1 Tax=unclassified Caballeronia TaxID=2646786 RepID=UPI002029B149|nr:MULTISPECIES: heavy metal translocating P-type ATPase [unclassified Caballeronia]
MSDKAMHRVIPTPRATQFTVVSVTALLLTAGGISHIAGRIEVARLLWLASTLPALVMLSVSIVRALRRREPGVDILALLSICVAAAVGESLTAAIISLMVASGGALEGFAQNRARKALSALLSRAPQQAHRFQAGEWRRIEPEAARPGDRLLVRAGESVPVDGTLLGEAALDESAVTGESAVTTRSAGHAVRSGIINAGAPFEMIATATARDSTFAGIVRMVETAQRSRSRAVRLADRYALLFVPLTMILAGGVWIVTRDVVRALAVLVVATPCPLILAVPVAIVSGISACAKRGVLIKDGGALERLASTQALFFDKTGTLTSGQAKLVRVECSEGFASDFVLHMAASLAQASPHVVAESVTLAARKRGMRLTAPTEVVESAGAGVSGNVDGKRVVIGSFGHAAAGAPAASWSAVFLRRLGREGGSSLFVDIDGVMAGALWLADDVRLDTPRALRLLRQAGIARLGMLTGDRRDVAEAIGASLGVTEVYAEQTPADKLAAIQAAQKGAVVAMVGDGINDAPALAAADVGIAMGARGVAASAEAADVVLLADRLDRLVDALRIARSSRRIAVQCVMTGMGLSIAAMIVAALGLLRPLEGAVLQELIDVAVIGNALRALRTTSRARGMKALPPGESDRLRAAHSEIEPLLDELRRIAYQLPELPGASVQAELERINERLTRELLPHEERDDVHLYPYLAERLAGDDPMAALSGSHREIFRLVFQLRRLAADLPADDNDGPARKEMQRLLFALDEIVRVHCAQEDELFYSLEEDV